MELSEYNGWENKFTWLMHLHLSNELALMQEVTALVASQSSNRAAGRLLNVWVSTTAFNWLCLHPERESGFDVNIRLLIWDMAGTALAYTDWDTLVRLLTGQVKKSKNTLTMTLYHFILSNGQLQEIMQGMIQAYLDSYHCADALHSWFREQVDILFGYPDALYHPPGTAALVNALLEKTYNLVVWEHVARAFRPMS